MSEVAIASAQTAESQLEKIDNTSLALRTTFPMDTPEGQDMAFAALQSSEPLSEHLGEVINLVHFMGQTINVVADETTGEMTVRVRTVIIDDKGNAYAATSDQLLNSLVTLTAIYGPPAHWSAPKPIVVKEERSRRGFRFFTVVPAPKAGRAS